MRKTMYKECAAAIQRCGLDLDAEIEDLVQTAWLAFLVSIKNDAVELIEPGLFVRIAQHTADNARQRRFNYDPDLPLEEALEVPAQKPVGNKDTRDSLERVFALLSAEDKALFEARVYDNVSYDELSREYGEETYVLKMRMYRIRKKIKDELDVEVEL